MARRITAGIIAAGRVIPATINLENNSIQPTVANTDLVLRGQGSGVVDVDEITGTTATISSISATTFSVTGLATLNELTEVTSTLSGATGTVTHDFVNGGIFYHTSMAANFTANFTNVPTSDNRGIAMVLILVQGGTGYYPNAVQINGGVETIKWANNTTPTPGTNVVDVATFTLFRISGSWTVLGNYTSYA